MPVQTKKLVKQFQLGRSQTGVKVKGHSLSRSYPVAPVRGGNGIRSRQEPNSRPHVSDKVVVSRSKKSSFRSGFSRFKPRTDLKDWESWKLKVKNFRSVPDVKPLFVQVPFDNRPYVNVKLYDESLVALLDNGANRSCLGQSAMYLIKKCELKVFNSRIRTITTEDGNKQKIIGSCLVPISVEKARKILEIFVVPTLKCNVILGSDFCNLFSLVVDFSNNSWQVSDRHNKFSINVLTEESEPRNDEIVLSLEQKEMSENIISLFKELSPADRLGRTDKIQAVIDTGDAEPFKKRQYPLSPFVLLDRMLALGVVGPSHRS